MRIAPLVIVVLLAAACGQKGDLYFRDRPPPGVKPPKPEAYKPQPYPKESAKDADEEDGAGAPKK
jgi:predicted small lipoprotein YifL